MMLSLVVLALLDLWVVLTCRYAWQNRRRKLRLL